MKIFKIGVILYLSLMQLITYFYCINFVGIGYELTYNVSSLFSFLTIIISFLIFVSNVADKFETSYKPYLLTIMLVILPISATYYFPFIFYNQAVNILRHIFPDFTIGLIYLSYYPTFYLAVIPQISSSIFSALSIYLYLSLFKLRPRKL